MPLLMISSLKTPMLLTYSGATLPPISANILKRIKEATFIEIAELLPESFRHLSSVEDRQVFNPKGCMVSDIVEWLQCFGMYVYNHHIMEAACQSNRSAWLPKSYHSGISGISGRLLVGVHRDFRQQVAATPTRWAVVDPTLWNLAFSGQAGTLCCRYCFSLSYCSSNWEILLTTQRKHTYSPDHSSPNNIPQTTSHHT